MIRTRSSRAVNVTISRRDPESDHVEPPLAISKLIFVNLDGVKIAKDQPGFLERNAMLCEVLRRLGIVPFEPVIPHS
jgi:hypothetical protein